MTPNHRTILVTYQDMLRLTELAEAATRGPAQNVAATLEDELARAVMVAPTEISADVVTMNSRVRYLDEHTGREREVVLVYPREASFPAGRISILSPVGVALLGLSVGESIEWRMPDGASHRLRVLEVLYQPEAAGDFHL